MTLYRRRGVLPRHDAFPTIVGVRPWLPAPTRDINSSADLSLRLTRKLVRQIASAAEIWSNPRSSQELKSQAFDYLNQLKSDPQGWQACVSLFAKQPQAPEVVRLVCLEVVNAAVYSEQLDSQALAFLKDTLLQYVQQHYGPEAQLEPDSGALQNKVTQTLTYLFVFLYRNGWESFIDDFWGLTGVGRGADNVNGIVLYLRVLSSIHDEIADMLLARKDSDGRRNNDLKDQLRDRDMHKVAEAWKQLLARHGNNDIVVELVLKVCFGLL